MKQQRFSKVLLALGVGAIVALMLINLDRSPAPWWDEGLTLNVAKNWVEHGHYGYYLKGEPAPPGLNAAFPTVASVALTFKLLGVGVWQGRFTIVVYTLLTLALLYRLGIRLYDRRVALTALVLLILLAPYPFLSPIYVGRQVLAEMPMLFFLLLGYAAFWLALQRTPWWLAIALVAWGTALIAKAQTMPFWAASLIIPLGLMLVRRRWKPAGLLAVALIGSYIAMLQLYRVQSLILSGHTLISAPLPGIYEVTGWVINLAARQDALIRVFLLGLPTVTGLLYAGVQSWRSVRLGEEHTNQNVLRLMLLSFAGSWFVWYLCLSAGYERYLFPAVFIGSLFTGAALIDVTRQYHGLRSMLRAWADVRRWRPGRSSLRPGVITAVVIITLPQIGLTLASNFFPVHGSPLAEVTTFLNNQTPPEAVIESYDAEIFVGLERAYHYPPDVVSIVAAERTVLKQDVSYDYNPLAADPDYLVVGSFIRAWHIYDAVIASGQFKPIYGNARYEVYERVR